MWSEEENLESIINNFFNENYKYRIKKDERGMIKKSLESHGIQVGDLDYFLSFDSSQEPFDGECARTFCYSFQKLVDIGNKEKNPLTKIFALSVPYEVIYTKLSKKKENKLKSLGRLRKEEIKKGCATTEQENLSFEKSSENPDIICDLLFLETGHNLKEWRMNLGAFLGRQETEAIKRSDDIFLKFRYNIKSLRHFDYVHHQYPYNEHHYCGSTHSWLMLTSLVFKNFQDLDSGNFQKEMENLLNTSDLSYENIISLCFEKTSENLKRYEKEIKENQEKLREPRPPQYDEWLKENLKHEKIIPGLKGDMYLYIGKFISKSREKNLEEKLTGILNYLSIKTDDNNLDKQAFSKAKEQYKKSRGLGNEERENDGKLGEACFELAALSEKPVERYKYYLEAILNFELSRFKENNEIENYSYIANSYQELGHLVSCTDLLLSHEESGQIREFTNNLFEEYKKLFQNITSIKGNDKLNEIYSFFEDLKVSSNSRFERDVVKGVAINLLKRALEGYNEIFDMRVNRQENSPAEDYSYRGKCELRLSKLKRDSQLIDKALSDLQTAVSLGDDSPEIHSLLCQAHFVKGHNYVNHSDALKKEEEFLKALNEFNESEKLGNTKREFYPFTSEIYTHLLSLEFTKENPNLQNFNTYLNEAVRYAQKANEVK